MGDDGRRYIQDGDALQVEQTAGFRVRAAARSDTPACITER